MSIEKIKFFAKKLPQIWGSSYHLNAPALSRITSTRTMS